MNLARDYIASGLSLKQVLLITGLTRHQLYHKPKGGIRGVKPSTCTWKKNSILGLYDLVDNGLVVKDIILIQQDPDQASWYKLITATLQVKGYRINHKKVYRLMKSQDLLQKAKRKKGRKFVKYRRVCPSDALRVLEMDIKYVWVSEKRGYAYILTILDTLTRYVLTWSVGYSMREEQVKQAWEYVIAHYLQSADLRAQGVEIEVRNDNGKQFASQMIQGFFKDNYLDQVFTHPYTPEENAHVERFHRTLGKSLDREHFRDLNQLTQRLNRFYHTYNNVRQHGSIAMLSPSMFWALWEYNQIQVIDLGKKRRRFKLKIAYQDVLDFKDINRYKYREMKI